MTIKRILSCFVTNIYLCTDKRLKLYFLKSWYKLSFLQGKWNWIFIGYTVCGDTHFPAKSCCISVNAELSFLSRCSKVFLVSAFSCKRMRISSSTSRTWKELLEQWEHENFSVLSTEWKGHNTGLSTHDFVTDLAPVPGKPISANPGPGCSNVG